MPSQALGETLVVFQEQVLADISQEVEMTDEIRYARKDLRDGR